MDAAAAGLAGTLIGIAIKTVYDHVTRAKERKDKYFFAMLQKRLEASQQAYSHCAKLKLFVHDTTERKQEAVGEARDWYDCHNLYLSPGVREDFESFVWQVDNYREKLKGFF